MKTRSFSVKSLNNKKLKNGQSQIKSCRNSIEKSCTNKGGE